MPTSIRRTNVSVLCACALMLFAFGSTYAQEAQPETRPDPLGAIGRFFEESWAKVGNAFKGAQGGVESFNREAGIAAKTGIDAAKDAAESVGRLGGARVIAGHQNCGRAANGAPDCLAAAVEMCKAKGFQSGKSVDITTAEECPVQVMLGRRAAEPGECKTVSFITRALCQ